MKKVKLAVHGLAAIAAAFSITLIVWGAQRPTRVLDQEVVGPQVFVGDDLFDSPEASMRLQQIVRKSLARLTELTKQEDAPGADGDEWREARRSSYLEAIGGLEAFIAQEWSSTAALSAKVVVAHWLVRQSPEGAQAALSLLRQVMAQHPESWQADMAVFLAASIEGGRDGAPGEKSPHERARNVLKTYEEHLAGRQRVAIPDGPEVELLREVMAPLRVENDLVLSLAVHLASIEYNELIGSIEGWGGVRRAPLEALRKRYNEIERLYPETSAALLARRAVYTLDALATTHPVLE